MPKTRKEKAKSELLEAIERLGTAGSILFLANNPVHKEILNMIDRLREIEESLNDYGSV